MVRGLPARPLVRKASGNRGPASLTEWRAVLQRSGSFLDLASPNEDRLVEMPRFVHR